MIFSKRSVLYIVVGAVCASILIFSLPYTTKAAESGTDWINGSVSFAKLSDFNPSDNVQYTYGNIPCESKSAYSWGWQSNGWTSWKVKSVQPDCVTSGVSTYIGYRQVLPYGSDYWEQLNLATSYQHPTLFPNPGANGLGMVTNSYADYVPGPSEFYYTDDVLSTFSTFSKDGAGNIVRSPSKPFEHKLTYPDGRSVSLTGVSGISYSANGSWIYLNVNNVGQLRVSTNDLSVYSFAQGDVPYYARYTAISNSGNTVATHEYHRGLKIYDLTNCDIEKPDYGSRECAMRDLTQNLHDAVVATVPDPTKLIWVDVSDIKFMNESELRLLVHYDYDNQDKYEFMTVNTAATEQPVRYLALGDSFSSGEGAGNYYEATNFYADANDYNFCHQSRVAYSELLNSWLKPDFYDSVACSGAVMEDVVYTGQNGDEGYSLGNPQSKYPGTASRNVLRAKQSNLPGYIPQRSLMIENTPTLATISLGGNDIGFGNIITSCVANMQCYQSRDDRERLANLIALKIPGLAVTFRSIKNNMAGSSPKLYVLGYPQMFAERSCGQFMGIEEQAFANHLVDYLNAAVELAAAQAGVYYVDVTKAFVNTVTDEDHRLCGNASSAVNGLFFDQSNSTSGQPFLDALFRRLVSSYHPNSLGNQLLASRIRQQTGSLSHEMPSSIVTAGRPSVDIYESLVGDTDNANQELPSVSEKITKDVVVEKGQSLSVSYYVGNDTNGLPVENASITVVVQSTPITLGTLTFQTDNTASGTFAIPSSLEPGMHTVHLLYNDISGQAHDVYQYIYVIASESDFDGDGFPNTQEQCAVGGVMGVDRDHDGIDDACDPEIAEQQVEIPTSQTDISSGSEDGLAVVQHSMPQTNISNTVDERGEADLRLSNDVLTLSDLDTKLPEHRAQNQEKEQAPTQWTPWATTASGMIVLMMSIILYLNMRKRLLK